MILRPGDEPIPGYQLERFLGKGQFGQVWQATSPGRASVALKFLDLSGKQGRKEFRAIQRFKQIRHAHLMPIIALWLLDDNGKVLTDAALEGIGEESSIADTLVVDVKETESERPSTLVVAQLLGDKTLGDRLQECLAATGEGIPPKELLTYIDEAARGIDFLNLGQHDMGSGLSSIHHCDIKPANILLLGDSVLITDYGLARVLADSGLGARATGMVGSPAYMAPECIAMKPGPASDQYSLAVSYVELRTGRLPFQSESFAAVLDSHREGRLDLSRLPAAERKVIQKATSVDPTQRYKSATEMAEALRRAVLGLPAPEKAKARQLVTLTAASIAAVIAIGVLIVNWMYPPHVNPVITRQFDLEVIPPDAELSLDGVLQPLSPDGHYQIERGLADKLHINARKPNEQDDLPPEYEDYDEQRVLANVSEDDVIRIELTPRPEHYVSQALRSYARGNVSEAIDYYAKAIKYDTTRAFRRVPSAAHRMTHAEDGPLRQSNVTPDRRHLITVGGNGVIRVWQLARDVEGYVAASVSQPVGELQGSQTSLEITTSNRWAVIADDGQAVIIDLAAGTGAPAVRQLRFPTGIVHAAISPDESWLVTASMAPIDAIAPESDSVEIPMELIRWNLNAADLAASRHLLGRHDAIISQLAIAPDSPSVFAASWNQSVLQYKLDGQDQTGEVVAQQTGEVKRIVAAPSYLAFGGEGYLEGSDRDSSVTEGMHFASIRRGDSAATPLLAGHRSPIEFMATCAERRWLVTAAEDDTILVWDTESLNLQPILLTSNHAAIVQAMAVSPDEQWIVTGKGDGAVELWDFRNANAGRNMLMTLSHGPGSDSNVKFTVTSAAFTADGKWIVVCDTGGVSVWSFPHCVLVKRGCDQQQLDVEEPRTTTPSNQGNTGETNVEA